MKSKVFFTPLSPDLPVEQVREKVGTLYDAAGFSDFVHADDLVALKIHFGEKGNSNFINPQYIGSLIEKLQRKGAKPFWTETSTLYVGNRSNAVDHILLAEQHGFGVQATGIPIVMSDGLSGRDEFQVEINGRHGKSVGIGAGIAEADSLILLSHATGHLATGFGGAIKNLGMGLSSRKGKLYQHSVVKPKINAEECRGDGACIKWCPEQAIRLENKKASIDQNVCVGCGECIAACRPGAVGFEWRIESRLLQERMVEQAFGVLKTKKDRIGYMTFINNVGKDCDCLPSRSKDVLIQSLGIVASRDVLALEQATLDLIQQRLGCDLRHKAYDIDYSPQLEYAQELGMGSREYQLVEV